MARIIFLLLLFASIGLRAQSDETDIKSLIDDARNKTLTPARVYGIMDAINYGKVSTVGTYTASGTNTYAVTVGYGVTNNDPNKQLLIKFTSANTSSTVTLNVTPQGGVANGALPLKTNLNADPDIGGIPAGSIYLIVSTGTTWRMVGPTNAGGVAVTNWGDIPTGNLQDQTDLYDTLNTRARRWYKIKTVSSNYTAALGDENNKFIIINGGADFKLPKDSDVNFPIGSALVVGDSLGTATFSKDALVTVDTLEQLQTYIKMSANKFAIPRGGSGGSFALTNGQATTANGSAVDLGGPQSDSVRIVGAGKNFTLDGQDRIRLNPDSLLIYTRDTLRLTLDKNGYLSHTGSGFSSSGSNSSGLSVFSANPYGSGFYNANTSRASVWSVTPTTSVINNTNSFGADASITITQGGIDIQADSLLMLGAITAKIGFSGVYGATGQMLKVNATGGLDFFSPSGTYTPTLNNTTNVAASTAYITGWYRVGAMVTVFGKVDIDVTLAASSATELGVSLPVASNMTGEQDLGGTAISDSIASLAARIKGDATNDRASIVFKAISLTNDYYSFEFSYQVK